ncbi:MAG: fused MFS/spermidine synthase [Gammaproteobacteria bacterium]|nr:fused MFS/spermidine synthase [Gammaproteobacteria bacterium]
MVLAVYMGGLALGAAVAEPLVGRISRPVLVYGLLEAGIAATALCVPMALDWAGTLYATILGNQPLPPDARGLGQSLFYLLAGFLILTIPTGLMGATLPVLMRSVVREDDQIGPRVALLYGINTAGAVAGAVIAGFFLLGSLGLRGTVWVGVAVNVLIFVIAAMATKHFPAMHAIPKQSASTSAPTFFADCLQPLLSTTRSWRESLAQQPAWILPVMLISGANTFIYEVLWTRLLSHVTGSSIYAFATMLAAFLTGIALGGAAAGRFARTRRQAANAFVETQVAIAAISLLVFFFLDELLPPTKGLLSNVILAASVLLPPAICIGLTFPMAVRILSPDAPLAAKCTARVYAWNTSGAIIGAIVAGFFLIPGLGFEGAIRFAVLVNLALALAVATLVATRSLPLKLGLLMGTLGIALLVHPNRPDTIMRGSSALVSSSQSGNDLYFGVGRNSTVRLTELSNTYGLRNNGLPEAQIFPRGAPPYFVGWNWLTSLPVAARPEAESILMVGLGGSLALEHLPPTIREVHVVELEEEIMIANQLVGPLRRQDPLVDPRVSVVINDARNALRLTSREYDIIVSQPSQPWTPGASHLYTTEFARLARAHLTPDGVLLQWMSASFLNTDLLRTLAATLTNVFEHVRLYSPDGTELMFIASAAPLNIEQTLSRAFSTPELAEHLPVVGIAGRENLLAALLLDEPATREFAAGAPLSSDDHNLMATQSRYLQDGMSVQDLVTSIVYIDPLSNPDFWADLQTTGEPIDYLYLSTRLIKRKGFISRLPGMAAAIHDSSQAQLVESIHSMVTGKSTSAMQQLRNMLIADPDNQQARYALVFTQLNAVLTGTGSRGLLAEATALTGVPAALLAALSHERAGDWPGVAALDGALADARIPDTWFADVIRIRAAWRLQPGIADKQTLASEALLLIDKQFPLQSEISQSILIMRATAAAIVGDAPAALESSAQVARQIRLTLKQAQAARRQLTTGQRKKIGAPLETVAALLEAHPEWRQEPRGSAVFTFVDAVKNQALAK